MVVSDTDQKTSRLEREQRIQRQIAFVTGVFQGDVTIHTLLESVAEGVVVIDNSGTILLVNAAAEQMFGYSGKDLIGKPHAVLIPERFRKVHAAHEENFFAAPKARPMGLVLDIFGRRRDGSEFPIEVSLSFINTAIGILVLAFVADITLRKQFEIRLHENESLFKTLVEGVKDYAIFLLDTQGNVLNWNAGAEHMKGYQGAEIVGSHFSRFYSQEDQAAGIPAQMLKKAATEGRIEVEGWRLRKDGSRFWADVIITALYDVKGELSGFCKVTRDISERKKVEEALRLSEARYRALYDDNPTMIATLDANLTMLSVNPICGCLLGYTTDELEGRSVLELFHEEDRTAVAGQLRTCLQNPSQVYRWQFRKIRKDGEPLWVEETAQAVHDLSGSLNILLVCQDVTERKRLEDELKKASMQNDLILASAGEGVVGLDLDGNQTFVNTAAAAMLGYEVNELVGKQSHATWHYARPDGSRYPVEECPVYAAYKTGTVYSGEEVFLRKDGTGFPVHFTSRPIYYDEKIVGAVLTFNDITERKRADEEREKLLIQLDAVLNSINEGVVIADLSGNLLTMNRSALAFHEYESVEQVRKQSHRLPDTFEVYDLDGRFVPFKEWPLARVLRRERFVDVEVRVRRKDTGSWRIGSYSGTPVQTGSGEVILAVITVRDITERKRAEAEIQRLASFPRMNPNPVLELDENGRLTFVNPAAERVLENIGHGAINPFIPPDLMAILQDLRDNKPGQFLREVEVNGRIFEELVCIVPQLHSVRIYTMDFTERKRAEAEIERLNRELAARAAELEATNRELEAFNYTVAHDLRKPLTVVNGYCQALQELCGDKLDDQCKSFLAEAYNGTWRMNQLIDALLDFSRLAHVQPCLAKVDLSAMAREVAAELQLVEPGRRVTFRIGDGINVDGDAGLLRVVLDNLLGNAWKYSSTVAEGVVEFGIIEVDGKPACFVRDNGAGFDMADAHKLFTPFMRLSGNEKCAGFGIGLATVERIVRHHGGRVWAQGEPGKGATFYFTLGDDQAG